jgi:hypothetical protein
MSHKNNYRTINQIGTEFNSMNSLQDLSNPLSFCLIDANTSRFLHGSSSYQYTPYSKNSQLYMAEYASGLYNSQDLWNQYAQYYYMNAQSINSLCANMGAINSPMFEKYSLHNIINNFNGKCNVGKYLLRNALERVLFLYPYEPSMIPYFPNIPNTNLIRDYSSSFNHVNFTCAPTVKNNLDKNPFIQQIMYDTDNDGLLSLFGNEFNNVNVAVCLDVLLLYNTLNVTDETNQQFTNFVRRVIRNRILDDIDRGCLLSRLEGNNNSFAAEAANMSQPSFCNPECQGYGDSNMSICSFDRKN